MSEIHAELGQPTNNQRARWANTALSAFVNEVGDAGDEIDNLGDLLGDLMHLCDGLGLDFNEALLRGRSHYLIETKVGGEEGQTKADPSFADYDEDGE